MVGRRFVVIGAWGVVLVGELAAAGLVAAGRVAPGPAQVRTLAELPLALQAAILATVERDDPAFASVAAPGDVFVARVERATPSRVLVQAQTRPKRAMMAAAAAAGRP